MYFFVLPASAVTVTGTWNMFLLFSSLSTRLSEKLTFPSASGSYSALLESIVSLALGLDSLTVNASV